ncbi:MAG: TRAP transporter substrate-binding protein DctP [Alphaproteobacteria bacterium]
MKHRLVTTALAAGLTFAFTAATTASAAEVSLKGAYFISSKKSLTRQAFDSFVDKINADGKGLVKVSSVVGQEAIPSRQQGNAVKSGLIDFCGTPPAYMANLVKLATGFTPTTKPVQVMRKNGAFDIFQDLFTKQANMHLLSAFGGTIEFHLYTNKKISKISDFKGMKLRTSNTYKAFFDALGARTLQMPRREIFTAMERGAVDGFANLDSEVMALGWHEVSKYKISPGFYHPIIIVGINVDKWKSLDSKQQGVLTNAGLYLENELSASLGKQDREIGNQLVTQKGMELIKLPDADAKEFLRLATKAQWDVVEKRDPVVGKKLRALIGDQ